MTWTDVASPPILFLPSEPLDNAAVALDRARETLLRAEDLEWVSDTAEQYRAELAELDARLAGLARVISNCQLEWRRARIAAWNAGQL